MNDMTGIADTDIDAFAPPPVIRILRLAREDVARARLATRNLLEALTTLENALTDKMQTGKFDELRVREEATDLAEASAMGFAAGLENLLGDEILLDAATNVLINKGLRALAYDGKTNWLPQSGDAPTDETVIDLFPSECWEALRDYRNIPVVRAS